MAKKKILPFKDGRTCCHAWAWQKCLHILCVNNRNILLEGGYASINKITTHQYDGYHPEYDSEGWENAKRGANGLDYNYFYEMPPDLGGTTNDIESIPVIQKQC